METINDLLRALGNKVPVSIAKRLNGLAEMNNSLESAREEHNADPSEESQRKLNEITEFVKDTQEELRDDLSVLVEKKREAELEARRVAKAKIEEEAEARRVAKAKAKKEEEAEARRIAEAKAKKEEEAEAEARRVAEAEAKEKEELKDKELEKETPDSDPTAETKKKSGIGWGGLIIGGALLILSAGAINYFGKKR